MKMMKSKLMRNLFTFFMVACISFAPFALERTTSTPIYNVSSDFERVKLVPICNENLVVGVKDGHFVCKNIIPNCTESQYVGVKDGNLICKDLAAAPTSPTVPLKYCEAQEIYSARCGSAYTDRMIEGTTASKVWNEGPALRCSYDTRNGALQYVCNAGKIEILSDNCKISISTPPNGSAGCR